MALEDPTARMWLKLAGEDLRIAELALGEPEPLLGPALFHSQQAAEKALKAAILEQGEIPPRIHDLVALLDRLFAVYPDLMDLREDARTLTSYAVEPRYPMEFQRYAKEEVLEATEMARAFLRRVESL